WFPKAAKPMVLQGAEILFYPTAIGSEPQDEGLDLQDHWKRVMQGHAGANLVPLVVSNRIRIGKEIIETEHGKSAITFYGNSFIAVYIMFCLFHTTAFPNDGCHIDHVKGLPHHSRYTPAHVVRAFSVANARQVLGLERDRQTAPQSYQIDLGRMEQQVASSRTGGDESRRKVKWREEEEIGNIRKEDQTLECTTLDLKVFLTSFRKALSKDLESLTI
ncbi:hypothetical protein M8C21_002960, partial [Ambrosia artemisiifolia]